MNRMTFPSSSALTPSRGSLLLFAAVLAVSLLSFYVHLLQQSVERGEQRRIEQRSEQRNSAAQQAMKTALPRVRFGEPKDMR